MIRLLDLYLARTLLGSTFVSLAVLITLSTLFLFVDQLSQLGKGTYDIGVALIYVLLSVPGTIEQFFPMAVLLGGLIGMGMLASNSELTVMQAAGLSRTDIIMAAMKSALVMVLIVMAVGEWVAPAAEAKAKEIRTQAISGGSLFHGNRLVWAKDAGNYVSIGEVPNKTTLVDVNIYKFDENLNLKQIVSAAKATFSGESWRLSSVLYTDFSADKITTHKASTERWQSSLTPDKLGVVTVTPETLSISGLFGYINYLKNNSQDPSRYELALWRKILQPVSISVMLLMALSFVFGSLRTVTMGARIIMGVLTGFGFFVANEIFGPLSMVYQLPPILGALLPSAVFAAVALHQIRK